jgi:hypothetical protein
LKNKAGHLIILSLLTLLSAKGQNNTFSPYSRYGLGELSQPTFAHNTGMGGAFIAHKADSTTPVFVNPGNPASYALNRITSLEVGGRFIFSHFRGAGTSTANKWSANFAYGSLGFPIRSNGGAAFGIMPFSDVGYETENYKNLSAVGDVLYNYQGSGGLNKAFVGYGIMPFHQRAIRYRRKMMNRPDSLLPGRGANRLNDFGSKLLSDFSMGFNANYVFGSVQHTARVVFPNSLLYNNTYRENSYTIGAFTGNFGAQIAITFDSIRDPKRRQTMIEGLVTQLSEARAYGPEQLPALRDSISASTPLIRRQLRERVKVCLGYIGNIQNPMTVTYNTAAFNYLLTSAGQEIVRDTVFYNVNQSSKIILPLEQGFGIAIKKGDRLNIVADYAITDWTSFRYLNAPTDLVKNVRVSAGVNYVPEKYASGSGAFWRTVNYRFGAYYQSGFLKAGTSTFSDYYVSAGLGMPVGINRRSAMVHLSLQVGKMGLNQPDYIRQTYLRVNFGFTFCDKWFQKFRYD